MQGMRDGGEAKGFSLVADDAESRGAGFQGPAGQQKGGLYLCMRYNFTRMGGRDGQRGSYPRGTYGMGNQGHKW